MRGEILLMMCKVNSSITLCPFCSSPTVLLQTQNSLENNTVTKLPKAETLSNPITTSPIANAKKAAISKGMAQPKQPPQVVYRGAIHCLTHTIRTRGFLSLYSGLPSPLVGSMAENAVLFLSYGEVKRLLGERPGHELSLFQLCMAGGVAGGIVSFVLNPFEVIKVQMQVLNSEAAGKVAKPKYTGVIDCVVQTIKNDGIVKGLYRGQTSLLLREIPGNICWYGVYEGVCLSQIPKGGTKRDLGMSTHLLGGACAGVAYWTAFYPADTVGSQMRANSSYASRGFVDVFMEIFKREGVAGLYKGWGITAARAAPAHALIFAMYEFTMDGFRRLDPTTVDHLDERSGSISHSS